MHVREGKLPRVREISRSGQELSRTVAAIARHPTAGNKGCPGAPIEFEGVDDSDLSTQLHFLKRWVDLDTFKIDFAEWNSSPLVRVVGAKLEVFYT